MGCRETTFIGTLSTQKDGEVIYRAIRPVRETSFVILRHREWIPVINQVCIHDVLFLDLNNNDGLNHLENDKRFFFKDSCMQQVKKYETQLNWDCHCMLFYYLYCL